MEKSTWNLEDSGSVLWSVICGGIAEGSCSLICFPAVGIICWYEIGANGNESLLEDYVDLCQV